MASTAQSVATNTLEIESPPARSGEGGVRCSRDGRRAVYQGSAPGGGGQTRGEGSPLLNIGARGRPHCGGGSTLAEALLYSSASWRNEPTTSSLKPSMPLGESGAVSGEVGAGWKGAPPSPVGDASLEGG